MAPGGELPRSQPKAQSIGLRIGCNSFLRGRDGIGKAAQFHQLACQIQPRFLLAWSQLAAWRRASTARSARPSRASAMPISDHAEASSPAFESFDGNRPIYI